MNTTTKTIILTLIIVSAAMMAGCLSNESSKEGNIHEDMTQLEAILTDPNYSDEEKYAAFAAVGEKYGAEIENHELESEVDSIPTPNMPKYQIQYSLMDSSGDPLAGIGWFTIVISGVLEYDQQICDFNKLALDQLESVEVFVNNESVDKYVPILYERRKITTTVVGDWIIRVEGTLKDGTIITHNSSFNGLRDMSDHPQYTGSGQGPFGERYVEPSSTSREEAKRICEEHGVVWGDDRDIPTPTPTLTSTKVTPTIMPTVAPTPEPEPTLPKYYMIDTIIDRTPWNKGTIALVSARPVSRGSDIFEHVNHIKIYVDDQIIATIEPTIPKYDYRYKIEYPIIINLPDDVSNTGEITMSISVFDLDLNVDDGDYIIPVYARTPPMRYEEEYSQFPVWNP